MSSTPAKTLKPGTRVERFLSVERAAVNPEARTVELAFASEAPYERWWGIEILDCTAQSMRMGRLMAGAPLLWNHNTDEQIGVVESVSIGADRVCRAVVRFGKGEDADECFTDVVDGIRRNVSVGYLIHKAELVEMTGDPNQADGEDTYRVTDWEPYEISLVSVPADPSVGVGRSAEDPHQPITEPQPAAVPPSTALELRTMSTPVIEPQVPAAPALNVSADADAARKAERTRISEIRAIADKFGHIDGVKAKADEAINSGETIDGFRSLVMNAITAAQKTPAAAVGLSDKETRSYSVLRAIRAMVERNWALAPFEREVHEAICKRAGIPESPNGGFFTPTEVQKRDLTVGTNNAGGYLVGTDIQPQAFIDLLRARTVVGKLGATFLPGLVGNVTVPKLSGAATGYWLANEATAITESQQTIGQLALSPKTVGAYTEVSRLLMLQSTPAADQLVMNDFSKVIALAIDLAALEGSGASGQPTGIANTAGIGSVTGTTLAYAGIIEFQTDVAAGNALTPNSAYVTTPTIAGTLAQRQRFSSTDTPLWTGNILDGQMAGFRATTTTQVTAASMVFGDFSQVVIGEWGMFELAMNPYANFPAGITGIRAIQSLDVGVRQAAAFSRATSIT